MEIGDVIITKGGTEYILDSFIDIKDRSGVKLIALNGTNDNYRIVKDILNYYIGTGIYEIKRKKHCKKLRRRNTSKRTRYKK